MYERYGITRTVARHFAYVLAITRDFREDYECGPTAAVIAPIIGVSTQLVRDRMEEMEGMGFIRFSHLNDKAIPGSINLTRAGYDFLRLWERFYEPLGFTFS